MEVVILVGYTNRRIRQDAAKRIAQELYELQKGDA